MGAIRGWTLLEILIALLIFSALLGLSLPEFDEFIEEKKSDTSIKRLAQALEFARISAISKASIVTMCRSRDASSCSGQWQDGVLIFSDYNGDRKINQDDEVLRHITFPDINGTIKWRAFQNRQYLQITPQGFTRYQNGNFTYCPFNKQHQFARQLIINRTARVRWAMDSDGDGYREDSRGRPIRCDD